MARTRLLSTQLLHAALLLCAITLCASCASPRAGGNPSGTEPPAAALSETDRDFMLEAASSGSFLMEASKLAEQRIDNPLIKAYAAQLVREHAAAADYLQQLARARSLNLPDSPLPEHRSALEAMKLLPAEELGLRYVQQLGIVAHQQNIQRYEVMVDKAADPELKGWATRMLRMTREHLAAAQRLPATTQAQMAPTLPVTGSTTPVM